LKTNLVDFSKLQFIRIFDPVHIPVELVEQVRDRKFSVEKFYEYQSIVCVSKTEHGMVLNPLNLLFVIVNEKKKVIGFLWAVVAPLSQDLVINTFSMHKDYWGKGEAVDLATKKCKEILKESGLNRVYWITNYPKHSERYGFKRAKGVLMEYNIGEENGGHITRERCKTSGASEPADSATEQISGFNVEPNPDASERCAITVAAGV
jgi:N-acetylglutamate synthase-like GNAT family acetyltransferase